MTLVCAPEHVAAEILPELLERVERGDKVEITRDGKPIASLAPSAPKKTFEAGVRVSKA